MFNYFNHASLAALEPCIGARDKFARIFGVKTFAITPRNVRRAFPLLWEHAYWVDMHLLGDTGKFSASVMRARAQVKRGTLSRLDARERITRKFLALAKQAPDKTTRYESGAIRYVL